jgi:putative alpha-1,2-mannosidase
MTRLRRSSLVPLSLVLSFSAVAFAQAGSSAADLVNVMIGTAAEGQTYPAAGVPFAMTQWTPQTRAGEVKCAEATF